MEHSIAGLEELVRARTWKYFQNGNVTIDLDELNIRNLRKVLAEMRAYAGLFILQDMIDDDEAGEYMDRYMVNTLFQVHQDITFYLDPKTGMEIVQNPVPIIRITTDFQRAANSSLTALQDPDHREQPIHD